MNNDSLPPRLTHWSSRKDFAHQRIFIFRIVCIVIRDHARCIVHWHRLLMLQMRRCLPRHHLNGSNPFFARREHRRYQVEDEGASSFHWALTDPVDYSPQITFLFSPD